MKTYLRKRAEIPVRSESDIVVVGAGPAGFGTAVAAARGGARVTLVERGGMAGGMWTLGLLSPFFDNAHHDGLNRELREALQERGAWGGLWNISFDPVQMAMLLDEILLRERIDLLLYAFVSETIVEDGAVRGVVAETKSGPMAVLGKTVVDCTGDGDVAALAGVPFDIGRPGDGLVQPMTMMFRLGGVSDAYPRDSSAQWYKILEERAGAEELTRIIPFGHPAIIRLPRRGEALIQWTHMHRRLGTNVEDLTAATMEGRRQVREAMKLFPLIRDVLGDVYLLELPSVVGVRETRRIRGEYTVSDEDVRTGARHKDNVCTVRFNVDIHATDSSAQTCVKHDGFDIPLRALKPVGTQGLWTAGRCISGSFLAHAAYRVTGDCLRMGESLGEALTRS